MKNNTYERLFELIRREEVILFVGAGFSIKAGYPSGNELGRIIFQNLTESEKLEFSQDLSLTDLSDEIIQLRGGSRNSLIALLKSVYSTDPTDISDHVKIRSIPHFKNIVTTNYDTVFEKVYQHSCNVIFKEKHCPYIEKSKTNIFKIHGDFSEPDSIIITKSDYRHYFSKKENSILWDKISDLLTSNAILFIGYSFEDDNIISIIEKLNDRLGHNRKEIFLIAPDWKDHKIQKLSSFRIKYFDDTAESFLNQLTESIKDYIIDDFDNKRITPDTFTQFCENHNISPDINISNSKNKVICVKPIKNQTVKSKLTFTVNDRIAKQIKNGEFSDGNLPIKIKDYDISSYPIVSIPADDLKSFEYRINDIRFSRKEDIKQLYLVRFPNKKGVLSIKTPDNNLYSSIDYELFIKNKNESTFKASTPIYKITIHFFKNESFENIQVSWQTEFNETYRNKFTAIYWTKLLVELYSGGKFHFYLDGHEISYDVPTIENNDKVVENLNTHIEYFENIDAIEKLQRKKFSIYKMFTKKNYEFSIIVLKYLKREFNLIPARDFASSFEFYGDDNFTNLIDEKPESRFFLFETSELRDPLILNGFRFDVKFQNIIYTKCKITNVTIKENGIYHVEFVNEADFIQISYTEKQITQEGLSINFFD